MSYGWTLNEPSTAVINALDWKDVFDNTEKDSSHTWDIYSDPFPYASLASNLLNRSEVTWTVTTDEEGKEVIASMTQPMIHGNNKTRQEYTLNCVGVSNHSETYSINNCNSKNWNKILNKLPSPRLGINRMINSKRNLNDNSPRLSLSYLAYGFAARLIHCNLNANFGKSIISYRIRNRDIKNDKVNLRNMKNDKFKCLSLEIEPSIVVWCVEHERRTNMEKLIDGFEDKLYCLWLPRTKPESKSTYKDGYWIVQLMDFVQDSEEGKIPVFQSIGPIIKTPTQDGIRFNRFASTPGKLNEYYPTKC
ncbi:hypothetical protein HK096_005882, partial [Nowakowskiella sp. JEL0078]